MAASRPGRLVFQAEALAGGQADAEEHRVVLVVQGAERQVVAETLAVAQFDTADLQEEFHFAPGEVVHQLVAGDAVLVEAAGLGAGLEEHHVVAVHGQAVGAGQPGRPAPTTAMRLPVAGERLNGCSPKPAWSRA